jgi:hypothetical protein
MPKSKVAKCDATQAFRTQAKEQTLSLVPSDKERKQASKVPSASLVASLSSDQTAGNDPDEPAVVPDGQKAGASPLAVAHPDSPASQEDSPAASFEIEDTTPEPEETDDALDLYELLYGGNSDLHSAEQRRDALITVHLILRTLDDAGWYPSETPCWWPYAEMLKWNRAHYAPGACKQKHEGLFIRNPQQMLKSLSTLMNNWATHEFRTCRVCKQAELRSPTHWQKEQQEYNEAWRVAQEKKATEERFKAEQERQAEEKRRNDEWVARMNARVSAFYALAEFNREDRHKLLKSHGGFYTDEHMKPVVDRVIEAGQKVTLDQFTQMLKEEAERQWAEQQEAVGA